MKKRIFILLLALAAALQVQAQDLANYKRIVKELSSSKYQGRGYANSDHYPFAVRGVPCIFLENEEGDAFQYYHTIYDNWKHAVFDSYEPVFKLVRDFIDQY